MHCSSSSKILSWAELFDRVRTLRSGGKAIVFTNGCFDLIHPGHVKVLEFSKSQGDVLVVGLNSDDSVRRLKGAGRPIQDQFSRAVVLAAMEAVDWVTLFDEDTPEKLVDLVRPDVLVKGADWKGRKVAGSEFAGRVVFCPFVEGHSTSSLVRRIR